MKIKTKLTWNVAVALAGMGVIAATSTLTIGYLQRKVSYLTERSTPFQVRTLELGRAEEGAIAGLLRVGNAQTPEEASAAQVQAERGLLRVRAARDAVRALSGDAEAGGGGLDPVAVELFRVTKERLAANRAANDADRELSKGLRAAQESLRSLETRITGLQAQRSSAFEGSMKTTRRVLSRLQTVQALKASLKDLQPALTDLQRADGKKAVLIARGKANAALTAAQENEAARSSTNLSGELKLIAGKVEEWAKARVAAPAEGATEALGKEAAERVSAILLSVEEELRASAENYRGEATRQESIFSAASAATDVLKGSSELVALGLQTEVLASAAVHARSQADLEPLRAALVSVSQRLEQTGRRTDDALRRLSARAESAALQSVRSNYTQLVAALLAPDGGLAKTAQSLDMEARSKAALDRLGDLVRKEAAKAEQSVAAARTEQEGAVSALHRVARGSFAAILGVVLGAMLLAAAFGVWIYRSVNSPLAELIRVSKAVAEGDLTVHLGRERSDEVGEVQAAMGSMVESLRGITGELASATARLSTSSQELSATAHSLEKGAQAQADQVSQSAAAVEEMAQTSLEVADNADATSKESREVRAIAQRERAIFEQTRDAMEAADATVQQSAERMSHLESRSRQITDIVDLIKDISDQTSLLALNAAIEASRAGEHGRGFAVVADNVRNLADRTAQATEEIAGNLKAMKKDIEDSAALMARQRAAIAGVVTQVVQATDAVGELTGRVDQVGDMVDRIAVAAEQQSATAEGLARNMESLDHVTRQLTSAFGDVEGASQDLLSLAGALEGLMARFKR